MKLQDKSILFWLVENRMKTETGQPIDFREHLYLADIYRDWSPRIVCKKAAQIGFTTAAFLKLCYALDKKKLDAIYTLPTDDEMKVLVGGKFNRLIAQNPVLQQLTKDKDSIEQKQFGDRMAYFRGTWGERQAISHSSDLNVHDEASRSKKDIVELYESRLQHSKFRWQWIFSNPSTKGDITDRYWLLSDQKEWHITCKECDGEQVLTWPESIDFETAEFVCKGCGAPLTVDDRRKGVWKATGSDMSGPKWSGYHISLLMAPWVTATQILDYYRNKSAEQFANFVLGEPYVGEGNTITEDIFTRNLTQKTNPQENVVIGCDSGIKKHYVCGNRNGLFHYDVTEDWEDISRLLIRWPRAVAVLDAMPDITGPRALRERFKGRVFLNHYAKDRKTLQLIRWGEGKEFGSVLSDRNRILQLVIDEFSDSRIPLEGTEGDWADFIAHWRTLFRVSDTDAVGNPTFRWETSTGNDHWAHACALWRIGMDRYGAGDGKILKVTTKPLIEVQKPFETRKFVQAVTKIDRPTWWDKETD